MSGESKPTPTTIRLFCCPEFETDGRDPTLTKAGMAQARKLGGEFDLVICSFLKRAKQTLGASAIFGTHINTILCREIKDGNPNHMREQDKKAKETPEQIQNRMTKFRELLLEKSERHQRIAVISHPGFLKELTGQKFENGWWWDWNVQL